jgi:hypothetical protein
MQHHTIRAMVLCGVLLAACQQKTGNLSQRMGFSSVTPQPVLMEGSAYYPYPEITPDKHYKSESSFCYKVQTDILCYDAPRAGWEDRLVGYQEPRRLAPVQPARQKTWQERWKMPSFTRSQQGRNLGSDAVAGATTASVGSVEQRELPPL